MAWGIVLWTFVLSSDPAAPWLKDFRILESFETRDFELILATNLSAETLIGVRAKAKRVKSLTEMADEVLDERFAHHVSSLETFKQWKQWRHQIKSVILELSAKDEVVYPVVLEGLQLKTASPSRTLVDQDRLVNRSEWTVFRSRPQSGEDAPSSVLAAQIKNERNQ